MREAAQAARDLHAHVALGMRAERGERLAQAGLLQAGGELGVARQARRLPRAQLLAQQVDDARARAPQHVGVVGVHGGRELGQLLQRGRGERGALDALERRDGGNVHGGMGIEQQAAHADDVERCGDDRQEPGAFEPLPPPHRARIGA